jgi:hypothetical protein
MVDPKITQSLPFFIWKPMFLGPQLSETPIFNQQGLEEMPSGSFRENHPLLKPGRSSTNGQFSMAGSQQPTCLATKRKPSSKDMVPATTAAVYSPTW